MMSFVDNFSSRLLHANVKPDRQDTAQTAKHFALNGIEYVVLSHVQHVFVLLDRHQVLSDAFLVRRAEVDRETNELFAALYRKTVLLLDEFFELLLQGPPQMILLLLVTLVIVEKWRAMLVPNP